MDNKGLSAQLLETIRFFSKIEITTSINEKGEINYYIDWKDKLN